MTPAVKKTRTEPLPVDETTTFPKLLAELDRRYGDSRIAVQEKRYGIWQPFGWHQLHTRVRDFAHGLASLGIHPGEVVAVLGDNRPEWLISELAAQSLGACTVGIYPTSVGEEIVHVLTDGQVRVVVAEDQEQVDKIIELKDRLPGIEHVIYYDVRGLEMYDVPYLAEFTAVEATGREWGGAHPGWLDEQIAAGRGDDVAVICTTSGTTGRPKLAMLSHANLLEMGRSINVVDPIGMEARYLSFLPLAWIGEQMIAVACGLQMGFTLSFAEEAATQSASWCLIRSAGPGRSPFSLVSAWRSPTACPQANVLRLSQPASPTRTMIELSMSSQMRGGLNIRLGPSSRRSDRCVAASSAKLRVKPIWRPQATAIICSPIQARGRKER